MKMTLAIIAMFSLLFVGDASAQSMLKKLGDAAKKVASTAGTRRATATDSKKQ